MTDDPRDPSAPAHEAPPALDAAAVRALLATPAMRKVASDALRAIVPGREVADLASEALTRALASPPPNSVATFPAWLARIATRTGADWLRTRARRRPFQGPMPVRAPAEDDYTGEPIDDERLDEDDDPARVDRTTLDGDPAGGADLQLAQLERLVADHARDRVTLALLREHAEQGTSYEAMASRQGLKPAQVANRILRFRKKYGEALGLRVRQRRQRMLLMLKVFAAAALAAALALAWWWRQAGPEPIVRDPAELAPPAAPSASASASPLDNALPPPRPLPPPHDEPRFDNLK